jgi:hypothetical protein
LLRRTQLEAQQNQHGIEIVASTRSSVVIAHNKARLLFFDRPQRRDAAHSHGRKNKQRAAAISTFVLRVTSPNIELQSTQLASDIEGRGSSSPIRPTDANFGLDLLERRGLLFCLAAMH